MVVSENYSYSGNDVYMNPAQLGVGVDLAESLKGIVDDASQEFEGSMNDFISQAADLKFDLDDCIDIANVEYEFENTRVLISDMESLAQKEYDLVEKYNNNQITFSSLKAISDARTELVNPQKGDEAGAWLNLVAWEAVIGAASTLETVPDIVNYYRAICADENGDHEEADRLRNLASQNSSQDFVRNSHRYRQITRGSDYDRDSVLATESQIVGSIAVGRGLSETNVQAVERVGDALDTSSTFTSGTNDRLESGEDFGSAVVGGATDVAVNSTVGHVDDYVEDKINYEGVVSSTISQTQNINDINETNRRNIQAEKEGD